MLYKFKPNYFLAVLGWSIEFDDKWEFNTTKDWQEAVMNEIGATKVVVVKKKTTKK